MSRIYGGIHFLRACNEGNRVGRLIGAHVWDKLNLRKPQH